MLEWILRLRFHGTTLIVGFACGIGAYALQHGAQNSVGSGGRFMSGTPGDRYPYVLPAIVAFIMWFRTGLAMSKEAQDNNTAMLLLLGEKMLAAYLAFGIAYGFAILLG